MGVIHFQGSKERLLRTISRQGGTSPRNQQFEIIWKCGIYKTWDKLPFRFRCSYEKSGSGFQITYQIRPTMGAIVRTILPGLLGLALLVSAWTPLDKHGIFCCLLLIAVFAAAFFNERNKCEEEFRNVFSGG